MHTSFKIQFFTKPEEENGKYSRQKYMDILAVFCNTPFGKKIANILTFSVAKSLLFLLVDSLTFHSFLQNSWKSRIFYVSLNALYFVDVLIDLQ